MIWFRDRILIVAIKPVEVCHNLSISFKPFSTKAWFHRRNAKPTFWVALMTQAVDTTFLFGQVHLCSKFFALISQAYHQPELRNIIYLRSHYFVTLNPWSQCLINFNKQLQCRDTLWPHPRCSHLSLESHQGCRYQICTSNFIFSWFQPLMKQWVIATPTSMIVCIKLCKKLQAYTIISCLLYIDVICNGVAMF